LKFTLNQSKIKVEKQQPQKIRNTTPSSVERRTENVAVITKVIQIHAYILNDHMTYVYYKSS